MKYQKLEPLAQELNLTVQEQKELDQVVDGELELVRDLYEGLYLKLYTHYVNEMPYGTAKGRDGDPDEWILTEIQYQAVPWKFQA